MVIDNVGTRNKNCFACFDLIENKPIRKKFTKKKKSEFVIKSLLEIIKKNKISLKNINFSYNETQYILKHILKNFDKNNPKRIITLNRSNNPVTLSKKDLTIIIKKILKT